MRSRHGSRVLFEAALSEQVVQILKRGHLRNGNKQLAACISDARLDSTFLVRSIQTRCTEMRLEEVMAPKGDEGPHFLARTPTFARAVKDDFHGGSQVVVADPVGNSSEMLECQQMPRQEAFLSESSLADKSYVR